MSFAVLMYIHSCVGAVEMASFGSFACMDNVNSGHTDNMDTGHTDDAGVENQAVPNVNAWILA